jgi:amino acid transporter
MIGSRKATLFQLIFLIYGVCAAGPYGLEEMVSSSGPGMTLVLLLIMPFLWAIPISLATAELASAFPVEGGYYRWARMSFGDFWSFQCAWWAWSANMLNGAAYAVLFTDYVQAWDPELKFMAPVTEPFYQLVASIPGLGPLLFADLHTFSDWFLCLLLVWALTWINMRGIRIVGDSSIVMNLVLLAPFAIITVLGLAHWNFNPVAPFVAPTETVTSAFLIGISISIWLYSGSEMLSTAAEEIENPQRNFPFALGVAVPMVALSYAIPTLAALASLGSWDQWAPQYFVGVGRALGEAWGSWLGGWVLLGGLLSNAILLNVNILSISRVPYAMAMDHFLPKFLAKASPVSGAPTASLLAGGLVYSFLTLFDFTKLIEIFAFLQAANYVMIYLSLVKLRAARPDAPRPFKIRGGRFGLALVVAPPLVIAVLAVWSFEIKTVGLRLAALAVGPLAFLLAGSIRRRTATPRPAAR